MVLFIEVLLLLAVVCALATFATHSVNKQRRSVANHPWRLEEHSNGECVEIIAKHPGEPPLLIGAIPWHDPDFEYLIEVGRAEGKVRLQALNSGRRPPTS